MRRPQRTAPRATYRWVDLVCFVVVLVAGGRASADDVWVGKPGRKPLKYSSVRIQGDEGGELVFRTRTGNEVSKPIEQIARVNVDDEDALNEAEELFASREYDDAIRGYEKARTQTDRPWLRRYVTARLIVCYDAEGRLVDAVKAWVETIKVWPTYGVGLAPEKLGRKGSQAHRQALDQIKQALSGDLTPVATRAVKRLRAAIWRVEQDPRAGAVDQDEPPKPDRTGRDQSGVRPRDRTAAARPTETVNVSETLASARRLMDDRRYDQAVSQINRAISSVTEQRGVKQLHRLLAQKGTCLMAQGDALAGDDKADQARRAYVHGGLAAMHVVTFFPQSASFIECLYLVAKCHEKIGRTKQAIALYRECREFAIGRKQPKWKNLSTEALKRLDVKVE